MADLPDIYVQRAARLSRLGETYGREEAKKLQRLHDRVLRMVEKKYPTLTNTGLRRLNDEIKNTILEYYQNGVIPRTKDLLYEVSAREIKWNSEIISGAIVGELADPNELRVANKAFRQKFQGKTFYQWFKGLGVRDARQVTGLIGTSYRDGATTGAIYKNVSAVMGQNSRHLKTLVRSSVQHVAHTSREELFQYNPDIIEGKEWVSILDVRTTPLICGIRDGLLYDNNNQPIGHSEPWDSGPGRIHFNCRSTFIPKLKDVNITGARPSIGAGKEYERGDKYTNRGAVRKPTKDNREKGIFKIDQVTTQTKYENWLRRQPKDFVADALGSAKKAKLFKAGEIDLSGFKTFDPSIARPLTIDQL